MSKRQPGVMPTFLVGLVPTYREGPLAAGAIRSILPACNVVIACEGPIGEPSESGQPTWVLDREQKVINLQGAWRTEADKRNYMLERTRRYQGNVWGLYLDADEIFIGAEYLKELIWAAEQANESEEPVGAIPLLITEVDYSVNSGHRLIRLDLLKRHVLSMSQLQFGEVVATFPLMPVWKAGDPITALNRPPMQGEPHIHHRSYYRSKARGEHRLSRIETDDFRELARVEAERLGIRYGDGAIEKLTDRPDILVAMELDPTQIDPKGQR